MRSMTPALVFFVNKTAWYSPNSKITASTHHTNSIEWNCILSAPHTIEWKRDAIRRGLILLLFSNLCNIRIYQLFLINFCILIIWTLYASNHPHNRTDRVGSWQPILVGWLWMWMWICWTDTDTEQFAYGWAVCKCCNYAYERRLFKTRQTYSHKTRAPMLAIRRNANCEWTNDVVFVAG